MTGTGWPEGPSGSGTDDLAAFRRAAGDDEVTPESRHLTLMPDTLEHRLRQLAAKWRAQSRHPQRRSRPEEAALLARHADELLSELHQDRQ